MRKTLVLVDGENLVLRYQAMVAAGRKPKHGVRHIPDVLVWHQDIAFEFMKEVLRVSYYTSAVGDDDALLRLRNEISAIAYSYSRGEYTGDGRIVPHVFKKERRGVKSRLVDIHITIDAIRHSFSESADQVFFLTGDGDFIEVIREVMKRGKSVFLGAFSSGLDGRLPSMVDHFVDLDRLVFEPQPAAPKLEQ